MISRLYRFFLMNATDSFDVRPSVNERRDANPEPIQIGSDSDIGILLQAFVRAWFAGT